MGRKLEGGCCCGAVRYALAGAPAATSRCHCRTCRRSTGAETVSWLTVRREDFTLTRGAPASHGTSPGVARGFCATCGTSITYVSEPGLVDVTIASLDDPEAVPPNRETWLEHRLWWVPIDPTLEAFPRGTDGD